MKSGKGKRFESILHKFNYHFPFMQNIILLPTLPYLYLTPVKTQLLQYNLTRDLMLFYHSVKIKA